ncbi:adenosylcobinamide-phosphate synthase CbiB [Desulfovibrio sp. OttesenSCG-928-O18]|nr:adenosylcobinamide-phosphate synthase CbiB [Desulfovibrio sp. OttesenSCG-928-O18]
MSCAEIPLSPFATLSVYWAIPVIAVVLDRVFGDPPGKPHPVRLIGAALMYVEPRARRSIRDPFFAGLAAACAVLAGTYALVRLLLALPWVVAVIAAVYLAFSGIALGQLLREGKNALALLERGDTGAARKAVGYLVSRDVSAADDEELCRVLAESLAENLNDAFIAPFFWLLAGGPVALWLYKAASTMDSMWGYPHEPWTRFGTFAARLDDVLAFIPARLTALFLLLASCRLCRKTPAAVVSDAKKMKSPNAGWPMAAAAWACGAAMGGKAVYAGKTVEKPLLGPEGNAWTPETLRHLLTLLSRSGYGGALALFLCFFGLQLLFFP